VTLVGRGREEPVRGDEPDVQIGARATARKVRFRTKPQTHVELQGEVIERGRRQPMVETASDTERENLPEEVDPGVTYHNVHIGWQATAHLPDAPRRDDRR
jgi:hypothetical protein